MIVYLHIVCVGLFGVLFVLTKSISNQMMNFSVTYFHNNSLYIDLYVEDSGLFGKISYAYSKLLSMGGDLSF